MTINEARPRPGRPPRFGLDELVRAALEIGPDALTLRAVSEVLGAPPTTIYNHVRNSEELGRMTLESLVADAFPVSWTADDENTWRVLLEDFAVHVRAGLISAGPWLHYWSPGIAAPVLTRANQLIERLVDDGFAIEAAGHALSLIDSVVKSSVEYHAYRTRATDTDRGESLLGDLNAAEFPWIAAADQLPDTAHEDARFHHNLLCAIDGIALALTRAESRE